MRGTRRFQAGVRRPGLGEAPAVDALTAFANKWGGLIKLGGTIGMAVKWVKDWRKKKGGQK